MRMNLIFKETVTEKERVERKKLSADSLVKRKFLIKKYGYKIGAFISNGYIKGGMTKTRARLSWRDPDQVHRTVVGNNVHEQWVYGSDYIYFENGILTAWQE